MPVTVTYPGVYIQELPSGQQTITPVATGITAFVGRAPIGPSDEPITIFNFGDYTRSFGGLAHDYPLSFAVQDFFQNGGAQAIIVRLFEPVAGEGDGFARLAFPPSPPLVPDGWVLESPAAKGAAQLSISPPTGGAESEPVEGMVVYVGNDNANQYLVVGDQAADPSKNAPASINIIPNLANAALTCAPLDFQQGPTPANWTFLTQSSGSLTVQNGTGIPQLGDTFTIAGDPTQTTYTVMSEPTITGATLATLQAKFNFSPKPPNGATFPSNANVQFMAPQPAPMPLGWQIDGTPTLGKTNTLSIVNGTGAPMPNDQFTVGGNTTVYVVTAYRPATAKTLDQIDFSMLGSLPLPTDPTAFCNCCTLNFTRPGPQNWSVKSGPKVGDISFVVSNNNDAATGVIDVGDTFTVSGDPTTYTVCVYDSASGTIYFLPSAATAFTSSNSLTFSPPLRLKAANQGEWGNLLTASADANGITATTAQQFAQYDLQQDDLFNLTLTLTNASGKKIAGERYLNVAVKTTGKSAAYPNRLDRVLQAQSNLAVVDALSMVPPVGAAKGSGGYDSDYLSTSTYIGDQDLKTGLYMLEDVQIFNLLCIPPDHRIFPEIPEALQDLDPAVRQAAAEYCTDRRAFYIVDPPVAWKDEAMQGLVANISPDDVGITGENEAGIEVARNAAVYFPRVLKEDPTIKNQLAVFVPCGIIAGVMAATDVARGVWKAPAGVDAGLAGVSSLEVNLNDAQNGQLNPLGINCLRNFPAYGPVVWGARTLRGADQFEDDYKYINVRRLTLFIEDSLWQGTQWAVFEPNDEALWSSLRLSVTNFLSNLSRQGAFYNYNVTCDSTTTTPDDISQGIVNILVQIAPVAPAEFVVIQIQQTAGQTPS